MGIPMGMGERAVTTLLTAKAGKREELLQILQSILDHTAQDPKAVQAVIAQGVHDDNLFIFHLIWADAVGLAGYLASDSFKVLLGASSILSEPAKFSFIADETTQSSLVTNKIRGLADLGATAPGRVAPGSLSPTTD